MKYDLSLCRKPNTSVEKLYFSFIQTEYTDITENF